MSHPSLRFRPMGIGDLLDETINLYRRHFLLFAGIEAVLLVPLAAVQLFLIPHGTARLSPVMSLAFAGSTSIYVALFGLAELYIQSAVMYAVSAVCLGEPITIGGAYALVYRRWWSLLGLSLLYGLAVVVLSVTLIGIPFAIYLAVAWGFSYPALLLEGTGVRQAFGRSRSLIRGSWWRVFGIILLVSVLLWIVSTVFSVPTLILAGLSLGLHLEGPAAVAVGALQAVVSTAQQVIIGPINDCCWILVYYDLRVRKEGFDLELQAREIGSPGSS